MENFNTIWYQIGDYYIDFRTEKLNLISIDLALEHTINLIIEKYPPPYNLMVSGGVDSQAMLYAWKKYGKNYQPVSVVYDDWLNKSDLIALEEFAIKNDIEILYKKFHLIDFYFSEYENIVNQFQCSSPQIGAYIAMTQDLPGTVIFSGMLPVFKQIPFDHVQRSLVRYAKTKHVIPFFFQHTPELCYSSIQTNPIRHPQHHYLSKVLFYQQMGFPVISQDKHINLETGFEGVKKHFDLNYKHLITPEIKLKSAGKSSRRVHDMLLRYTHLVKIGDPFYKQYWL